MTADWQKPIKTIGKIGAPVITEELVLKPGELERIVKAALDDANRGKDVPT